MIPFHKISLMILDIHTHHPAPSPDAIISLSITDDILMLPEKQLYSVGIHPWDIPASQHSEQLIPRLHELASLPCVAAIGEAGIDTLKGGALAIQMNIFASQIKLSEELAKPLIIHNVKAHDIIASMHRDLKPTQPWIIHGFRGKTSIARILLDAGCSLSFGEYFNPESLKFTPTDRIFAETDESSLQITEIIARMSEAYGTDLLPLIAENTQKLLRQEDTF